MKSLLALTLLLVLPGFVALQAAGLALPAAPAGAVRIVERGPHHRTLAWTVAEPTPYGGTREVKHQVVVLASGMHYQGPDGQWLESREVIERYPGGAIARQGQIKALFANSLATAGAIDLELSDGRRLRSHPLLLAYYDRATQRSVRLAEVKDSAGIVDGNCVYYADALTEVAAIFCYRYTLGGVSQDLLLLEPLEPPEVFGLDSRTTTLQLWTEWLVTEPVTLREEHVTWPDGTEATGQEVDFGTLRLGPGKAFRWGADERNAAVPVLKTWKRVEGRDFLIEEVPVAGIAEEMNRLPPRTGATPPPGGNAIPRTASLRLELPPAPRTAQAHTPDTPAMLLARYTPPARAFTIDYEGQLGPSNYTFRADTTYCITNRVNLYGTTMFEGGSVLKFADVSGGDLWVYGTMQWDTGPFRPTVFTSINDDLLGESIPGSTGSPQRQQHVALVTTQSGTVRGARFLYARTALCPAGASLTAEDVQFVNCGNAIDAWGQPVTVRNGLFSQVTTLVAGHIANLTLTGEHWTSDGFSNLVNASYSVSALNLTNCLFTAGANWIVGGGSPTFNTNAITWLSSSSGVYQTVGAGRYYLADSSPYRNAGASNLSASAQALIQPRTTCPPLVFSNVTFTTDTTFSPQAQRDTDAPDLGYHYAPLDYVFGGCHTTNANLTVTAGTALGWFRTTAGWYHAGQGIHLDDNDEMSFNGTVAAPTWWVHFNTVQEGGISTWAGGYGPGGITSWAWPNFSQAPRLTARFLRCSALASESLHIRDDWGWLIANLRDCELYSGGIAGYNSLIQLTNCLLYRASVWLGYGRTDGDMNLRNCTFHGGDFQIGRVLDPGDPPLGHARVSVRDCAFDQVYVATADPMATNAAYTDYGWNAWNAGASGTTPAGTNDLTSVTFNWQIGALGNFYLPTNSVLKDAGSLTNAALAGLYHHTTQTNQAKEATTRLDIGYHYVACTNGVPVDTDSDGLPDYQDADSDGDGLPDAWEFEHFGNLSQDWDGDYDGDGTTNGDEYLGGTDPNTLNLMTQFETLQTTNRTVAGTCLVFGGVPASMAVLVNDTNLATAVWAPFTSSFTATLPNTDGVHSVVLAVRGLSPNIPAVVDATDITLDRVPPVVCLTNPATATVTKPYLQLQGRANEPLASLAYDLTNAAVALANEPAYVVDQYFDTNQFDFTTNYFQAYDLELTNGANAITLRVSDLAGNVTTTNFTVTLSYASATNPPVLALIWPTNGTALSGDTFFLRGHINDETARLWAENVIGGVTNEFPGLVERDGMFWVESLPLATGTNWFIVKALDAAGNLSSTNLAVVQSSVSLAITATPEGDALYTPFGTVSGTVTATNPAYSVTVNGVAATVDAYGNWTATDVPVFGRGTATFSAMATAAGGGPPVGATVQREMPARIEVVEHRATKHSSRQFTDGYHSNSDRTKRYKGGLQPGPTGDWVPAFSGTVEDYFADNNGWVEAVYQWTATNVSTYLSDSTGWDGTYPTLDDPDGTIRCLPEKDVRFDAPGGTLVFYITNYYARSVKYTWNYPGGHKAAAAVDSKTKMSLYTGGKSGIKRKSLFHIIGGAEQYGRPPGGTGPSGFPWTDTPVTNVPATKIQVMGWWLFGRHLDANGELYVTLPDNVEKDLNLRVMGLKHYGAGASVEKLRLDVNSVAFQGSLPIQRDDGSGAYDQTHWQTNEATRVVISSPVLYVSGSNVQTTTVFTNHALSSSGVGGDFPLIIKGVVSGGHTSFKLWGTNLYWVGTSCTVDLVADHPLTASKVDFFQPMAIKWYYGYTNKPDYIYAGTSTNQVYVSLRPPTNSVPLYHTVVHLACANSGATTESQALANTWACFQGPADVKAWNGLPLYYYKDGFGWTNSGTNTGDLLASATSGGPWAGHGQCGSFAHLLIDALAANGIASDFVTVVPTNSIESFIVKSWQFPTNGSYGGAYPYWLELVEEDATYGDGMVPAPAGRLYGELTKLNVLKGQNTSPPSEEWFGQHFIAKCPPSSTTYYDPSYGVTYTGSSKSQAEADFEAKAVAGYARRDFGQDYMVRKPTGAKEVQFDK